MPRLPGERFNFMMPGRSDVGPWSIVVNSDRTLACHDFVLNFNEHLFSGRHAFERCLAELTARISMEFGALKELDHQGTDVIVEFPFPENPERRVLCD